MVNSVLLFGFRDSRSRKPRDSTEGGRDPLVPRPRIAVPSAKRVENLGDGCSSGLVNVYQFGFVPVSIPATVGKQLHISHYAGFRVDGTDPNVGGVYGPPLV